jgi:hypothetical protein
MSFMNAGKKSATAPNTDSNGMDAWNINKIKAGTKVANLDMYSAASEAANERAANSQQSRDRTTAIQLQQLQESNSNRDVNDRLRLMREEASLKNSPSQSDANRGASENNTDYLRKATNLANDRLFAREESEKNRQAESMRQMQQNYANKDLAAIQQQNQIISRDGQVEQAAIAAKAQVTSALYGNRPNYGGYW